MEYKTIRVNDIKEVPQEGAWHLIMADGNQSWYINGLLHREDDSAIILADGSKYWYKNGQRHKEDGPAIIKANGEKHWYKNSQLHREDGPAVIWADGAQNWYLNNQLHRADGPAIILPNGTQFWYLNGRLHREDGPAKIWADGAKWWYLNGCFVSQKAVENPKELTINDIMEWDNVEGQRIMINIYGLERFIFDSNPKIIDMDYHDQNGHRVLLKVKGIRGQWLCCSCPSTGRTYFMGVPDDILTCEGADEWLSGSLKVKQVGRT